MIDEKDRENAQRLLEAINFAIWKERVQKSRSRSNDLGTWLIGVLCGLALAGLVFVVRILVELLSR